MARGIPGTERGARPMKGCRLTADCVSAISSDAALKLRCRATASKARKWPAEIGRVRKCVCECCMCQSLSGGCP